MASRIVAQLLVAGATTLLRAGSQAFAKALQNAQKSGVAQETAKAATRATMTRATMTLDEAKKILEVADQAPWAEVMKRYKHLFDVNKRQGSFYLQSKVYRAWEALDEEYTRRGLKPPGAEGVDAYGEPLEPQQEQQQQQGGSLEGGQQQQQQQQSTQQQQQQQQNDR